MLARWLAAQASGNERGWSLSCPAVIRPPQATIDLAGEPSPEEERQHGDVEEHLPAGESL